MLSRVLPAVRALTMPALTSLALVGAAPALAQTTPATTPTTPAATTVPAGVTIAGVDVGGLDAAAAAAKLETARTTLQRDVSIQVGTRKHKLSAGQAGYSVDAAASVTAALAAKAPGNVNPVVKYNDDNVRAFVKKVAEKEYRAPRDARIAITPDASAWHRTSSAAAWRSTRLQRRSRRP